MEMLASMPDDAWAYGDTKIVVLSCTLKESPLSMKGKVEMYSGDLLELTRKLERDEFTHAYIDGGKTIQSFLDLKLIDEMTITRVPVILGEGKPLFGKTTQNIKLENAAATVFPNDFVQVRYTVAYQ